MLRDVAAGLCCRDDVDIGLTLLVADEVIEAVITGDATTHAIAHTGVYSAQFGDFA